MHLPGTAAAVAGRGGPLPLPPRGVVGPKQQRLPAQWRAPVPGRGQPSRVRHPRVRQRGRPGRARQGGGADPRGAAGRRRPAAARGRHRGDIYLFKNNTDSAGNSYGCHENYLVGRHGRVRPARRHPDPVPGHQADHLRRGQGAADAARRGLLREPAGRAHLGGRLRATTRSRPIINTRDEPHADAERFAGCTSSSATPTCPRPPCCSRSAPPTWCCAWWRPASCCAT